MSFDTLPAELYDSILSHVPFSDLQQTTLSVTRAIPLSPVSLSYLFRSIRITHPAQAILLYRRLRLHGVADTDLSSREAAAWVKEISIESWSVEADVILRLLRLLRKLQTLNLWIGPDNFTPEHLEELFLKPFLELKYLSLRFRPYVQKATYYQFLQGAYFDSTLLAISRWPTVTLPTLSIIQDPLEHGDTQKPAFAQPLVFFRLDPCLSILIHSTTLSPSLTSLRIRIPARPVARSLCTAAAYSSYNDPARPLIPPNLIFLDLSTCGVLENELVTLLVYFRSLQHIILDECAILRGDLHDGEYNALGKRCALVGVRRAKEREKLLKNWLESRTVSGATDSHPVSNSLNAPVRQAKLGRKGLATSTISLRTPSINLATSSSASSFPQDTDKKGIPKIRILPPLPCLLSLSVTLPAMIKMDKYPIVREEFEAGWAEGIAQLAVTRATMMTSAGNGVRVMRLVGSEESESDKEDDEFKEGLKGLVDVDPDGVDAFGICQVQVPVLCFAGAKRDGEHPSNCGHMIGWERMYAS